MYSDAGTGISFCLVVKYFSLIVRHVRTLLSIHLFFFHNVWSSNSAMIAHQVPHEILIVDETDIYIHVPRDSMQLGNFKDNIQVLFCCICKNATWNI